MKVLRTAIPDVKVIEVDRFEDERGFFSEPYNRRRFQEAGFDYDFVQDNHSLSRSRGTIRGLHFQLPPFAQTKLVRVVRGAIVDVAVDLRRGSPTFGRHVSAIISAERWNQILVPIGFAHGFCTIEPDTEVLYKVDNYYAPDAERGLLWNDPILKIDWPVGSREAMLSPRDREHPTLASLADLADLF